MLPGAKQRRWWAGQFRAGGPAGGTPEGTSLVSGSRSLTMATPASEPASSGGRRLQYAIPTTIPAGLVRHRLRAFLADHGIAPYRAELLAHASQCFIECDLLVGSGHQTRIATTLDVALTSSITSASKQAHAATILRMAV